MVKTFRQQEDERRMKFVTQTVKQAIAEGKSPRRAVVSSVGCSPSTADRLIKRCKTEGYLEGVEFPIIYQNAPLTALSKELSIDENILREAIIRVGGRVAVKALWH